MTIKKKGQGAQSAKLPGANGKNSAQPEAAAGLNSKAKHEPVASKIKSVNATQHKSKTANLQPQKGRAADKSSGKSASINKLEQQTGSKLTGAGGGIAGKQSNASGGVERPFKAQLLTTSQFLSEVLAEFRKISWPERSQVIRETVSVLFLVALITVLVLAFDWVVAKFVFTPLEHWGHLYGIGANN